MVHAVLSGELEHVPHWHMDELNLDVPEYVHGVEQRHFRPRDMWDDKETYDRTLAELVVKFHENWNKKFSKMPEEIRVAGPRL
jgi:phosphoenolpyruvate carboxykinase (ATP)